MESFAPSRNERKQQHTRSMPRVTRTESEWANTGAFSGMGRPKVVGVSDVVAQATRKNAAAARRAEKKFMADLRRQGIRF